MNPGGGLAGLRIILVRHGETAWNHQRRYQGHRDVPLSLTGRWQAERVAGRLAGEKLRAVYSSDLQRARQTAEAIARLHGLRVLARPGWREMDFGEWEGYTHAEIAERYPDLLPRWLKEVAAVRVPGGETLQEVQARAMGEWKEITAAHPGGTLAVVAHGGIIRVLLLTLQGEPLSSFWDLVVGPASVSVVVGEEGRFRVVTINDCSHLDRKGSKPN